MIAGGCCRNLQICPAKYSTTCNRALGQNVSGATLMNPLPEPSTDITTYCWGWSILLTCFSLRQALVVNWHWQEGTQQTPCCNSFSNDKGSSKGSHARSTEGHEKSRKGIKSCKKIKIFEGSQPEWCISSMIYSTDTPFWSETLEIKVTESKPLQENCRYIVENWKDERKGKWLWLAEQQTKVKRGMGKLN